MRQALLFCLSILTVGLWYSAAAQANPQSFDSWLTDLRAEAKQEGISGKTLDQALDGIAPLPRVIELDRKQPEGRLTFNEYRKKIVSPQRIEKGKEMFRKHYHALQDIAHKYGVQSEYIVALWGIETNYGGFTGNTRTIDALATLAYDGRRSAFFRKELITALHIIDQGHIQADDMKGSWAGALGQNQFMPSSFMAYALDESGDGRKDIWGTLEDVFASSANYLARSGWHGDERWGRQVRVPSGMDQALIGTNVTRSLSFWRGKGVKAMDGTSIPVVDGMEASLIQPDGTSGDSYLVYNNYKVLLKWNRSVYFATSVGLIANALASVHAEF